MKKKIFFCMINIIIIAMLNINSYASEKNIKEVNIEYGDLKRIVVNGAENSSIKYESNNEDILTVDEKGNLFTNNIGEAIITIIINDTTENVLKVTVNKAIVDVILFSGQSNMVGTTTDKYTTNIQSGMAYEYKKLTNTLTELKDPCGENIKNNAGDLILNKSRGSSLIPAFCERYISKTGRKVVAVHAARGGAKIETFQPTTERYKTIKDKYNSAIKKVSSDGRFQISRKLYVFLQGETDVTAGTTTSQYISRFKTFHNALKKDCGITMCGLINIGYRKGATDSDVNVIINAQNKLIAGYKDIVLATAVTKKYSKDPNYMNTDMLHYNAKALRLIGISAANGVTNNLDVVKPEIQITPNGVANKIRETAVKVTVKDTSNIKNIKTLWSTKESGVTKLDFDNNGQSITNGGTITKKDVNGKYYLWVMAIDAQDNINIIKSNEFNFDNQGPNLNVSYTSEGRTVKAIITSNEAIQGISGWTLSADKLKMEKVYTQDTNENIVVSDLIGNQSSININVKIPVMLGDLNKDNNITLTDLAKAQKIYLGLETSTEYTKVAGDMNQDGIFDLKDLAKLQKIYLGI